MNADPLTNKQRLLLARLLDGATLSADRHRCRWRLHPPAARLRGVALPIHFKLGRALVWRGLVVPEADPTGDGRTCYVLRRDLPPAIMAQIRSVAVMWPAPPPAPLPPGPVVRVRRRPKPPPRAVLPPREHQWFAPGIPEIWPPADAWRAVPARPTTEQVVAGAHAGGVPLEVAAAIYRAMIGAVPGERPASGGTAEPVARYGALIDPWPVEKGDL